MLHPGAVNRILGASLVLAAMLVLPLAAASPATPSTTRPAAASLATPAAASSGRQPASRGKRQLPEAASALRVAGPLSLRLASYRIQADLDHPNRTLRGKQRLTFRNSSPVAVGELCLHLYMNALANSDTRFARTTNGDFLSDVSRASGFGYISLRSLRLAEADLLARARLDETLLYAPLPTPIAPGASAVFELEFETRLPEIMTRTGYRGDFYLVGQWFPKVGVLDREGKWICDPFEGNSEFFADFGTYDVEIVVPSDFVVAATGIETREWDAAPGRRGHAFRAEDVHDFAFAASPDLKLASERFQGIELIQYHLPGYETFAARVLVAAKGALTRYARWFGPYPYSVLRIVDPPDLVGGPFAMEYPTLVVTMPFRWTPAGYRYPEEVALHELTHQYFYGLLASNEVREPWLDEGLTQYATGLVLDDLYGADRSVLDLFGLRIGYFERERLSLLAEGPLAPPDSPAWVFPDQRSYGSAVYSRSALLLKTAENLSGREALLGALGVYAREHRFGHPTTADLLGILAARLPAAAIDILRQGLFTDGLLDYEVSSVEARVRLPAYGWLRPHDGAGDRDEKPEEWRLVSEEQAEERARRQGLPRHESVVEVRRLGELTAAVDVRVAFDDGSELRQRWDGRGRSHRFVFQRNAPVSFAEVDPDGKLALEVRRANNGRRREPCTRASWRLSAGLLFALQSMLQWGGL